MVAVTEDGVRPLNKLIQMSRMTSQYNVNALCKKFYSKGRIIQFNTENNENKVLKKPW